MQYELIPHLDLTTEVEQLAPGREASHRHGMLEVILVTAGQSELRADGVIATLARGDVAWIPEKLTHSLTEMASGSPLRVLKLRVSSNYARRVLSSLQVGGDFIDELRLAPISERSLRHIMDVMASCRARHAQAVAAPYLLGLLAHIPYSLGRSTGARPTVPSNARGIVKRATGLLHKADFALRPAQLAKQLHVSYNYLARVFKHDTGMTLIEFRNQAILDMFLARYTDGENLLTAALDAGFGSYAQFYRVFRERFGTGPREYFRGSQHDAEDVEVTTRVA